MKANVALRASACVLNRQRASNSHSSVAKKLSHMALSYASPTEPIEGRTPASRQRWPNSIELYWRTLVGVMDDASGPPRRQCHVQSIEHQLFGKCRGHGPADNATAICIEHHREIQKAGPCRNVGVSRPKEFHLRPLAEPDVNLSAHPAPTIQPTTETPTTSGRTLSVGCARAAGVPRRPVSYGPPASCACA